MAVERSGNRRCHRRDDYIEPVENLKIGADATVVWQVLAVAGLLAAVGASRKLSRPSRVAVLSYNKDERPVTLK